MPATLRIQKPFYSCDVELGPLAWRTTVIAGCEDGVREDAIWT